MPEYRLTREEWETHISWNAAEKIARIDTVDPAVIHKLDKLVEAYPETYKVTRTDARYGTKWYEVNARYVRFGRPATEARREANRIKGLKAQELLRKQARGHIYSPSPAEME